MIIFTYIKSYRVSKIHLPTGVVVGTLVVGTVKINVDDAKAVEILALLLRSVRVVVLLNEPPRFGVVSVF
jgi:hypothetical protein